jgi:hypothetical protein
MFDSFFDSIESSTINEYADVKVTLYPINEYNLDGLKILYHNTLKLGGDNKNVQTATYSPKLFLPEFLNKYWRKISYVTTLYSFSLTKIINDQIVIKNFECRTRGFESEEEMDEFFSDKTYHQLVFHSIIKTIDLQTLKTSFRIRYVDISETKEIRDVKLNEILE